MFDSQRSFRSLLISVRSIKAAFEICGTHWINNAERIWAEAMAEPRFQPSTLVQSPQQTGGDSRRKHRPENTTYSRTLRSRLVTMTTLLCVLKIKRRKTCTGISKYEQACVKGGGESSVCTSDGDLQQSVCRVCTLYQAHMHSRVDVQMEARSR